MVVLISPSTAITPTYRKDPFSRRINTYQESNHSHPQSRLSRRRKPTAPAGALSRHCLRVHHFLHPLALQGVNHLHYDLHLSPLSTYPPKKLSKPTNLLSPRPSLLIRLLPHAIHTKPPHPHKTLLRILRKLRTAFHKIPKGNHPRNTKITNLRQHTQRAPAH